MGKFDGVLFLSDFDNTILYTEETMKDGGICPEMPPQNLDAIHYFMAEGGHFGVATGRATDAFRPFAPLVPTNLPAIVNNGGGIYDYEKNEYIEALLLQEPSRAHIAAVVAAYPAVSLELPSPTATMRVYHESVFTKRHATLTGVPYEVIDRVTPDTIPIPLTKALFLGEEALLRDTAAFIEAQDWCDAYELIFSGTTFLELTAKGATKGGMAQRMMTRLGCHTLVCAGDHLNDLSMLTIADAAFCPANAVPEVKEHAVEVCHCREGAIAEIIAQLSQRLS